MDHLRGGMAAVMKGINVPFLINALLLVLVCGRLHGACDEWLRDGTSPTKEITHPDSRWEKMFAPDGQVLLSRYIANPDSGLSISSSYQVINRSLHY